VDAPTIARFEFGAMIQRGGMGEVWRATDRLSGGTVAVKLTHRGADLDRFQREAEVLASLSHPGIVRHLAHGVVEGRGFLAMEWLSGEDLAARLRREAIPGRASLLLVRRIADALASAHAQGVVHRDLKPANIFLVDGDLENIRLIDFGIARVDDAPRTTTGVVVGTWGYMSPEQAMGERNLDARADIFSLGCVLYECIAGEAPFRAPTVEAVLAKLLFGAAPKLSRVVPGIHPRIDSLVTTMLANSREQRPESAAVLTEWIDGILGGRVGAQRVSTAIGVFERRVMTLMLSREDGAPPDDIGETCETVSADIRRTVVVSRDPMLAEQLGDGAWLVRFSQLGTPGDQVNAACNRALALLLAKPSASVAIVTGLADESDPSAEDVALTRARHLLGQLRAGDIGLDSTTAPLAHRYHLEATAWGARLLGSSKAALAESAKESPIVGRERELRLLERAVEDAAAGNSSVVVVLGEAGGGKTALSREFQRRLASRAAPCRVVDATAEGLDVSVPYALLRSILRSAYEVASEVVGASGPALQAVQQHRIPVQDELVLELKSWLYALAECGLCVLLLHDAHWADEPSVRALARAFGECEDTALLVALWGRPDTAERFGKLLGSLGAMEVTLRPLPTRAAKALVARAAGGALSEEVQAEILERGQGSPYVLQELVRAAKNGATKEVPAGVLGIVQANVARLAPEVRRLLRAASVLGQRFTLRGAMAVLGEGLPLDPEAAVAAAVDVDVLRADDGGGYAFRHSLTHEAVYAMLADVDRAAAHARAARWLREVGRSEPSVMAHHFARAGEVESALQAFRAATDEAESAGDRGAIARIEAEVAAIAPESPLHAHVLHQLSKYTLGGTREARAAAARAALAKLEAPSAQRVAIYVELVQSGVTEGNVSLAIDELERASVAGVVDDHVRLTTLDVIHNAVGASGVEAARTRTLRAIGMRGDPSVACTYWLLVTRQLERNLELAAQRVSAAALQTGTDDLHLRTWYAYLLIHLGRLAEAHDQTDACARRVRLQRSFGAASVLNLRCGLAEARGELELALQYADEGLALLRAISGGDDRETVRLALRRADLLRRLDRDRDVVEAIADIETGLMAFQGLRPLADANLASALAGLGQRDEALRVALRGLSFLHDEWTFDGGAFRPLTTLGRALLAAGAGEAGVGAAKRALVDVRRYLDLIGTHEHRVMFLEHAPGASDAITFGRELGLGTPSA